MEVKQKIVLRELSVSLILSGQRGMSAKKVCSFLFTAFTFYMLKFILFVIPFVLHTKRKNKCDNKYNCNAVSVKNCLNDFREGVKHFVDLCKS